MMKKMYICLVLMLSAMIALAQQAPENNPEAVQTEDVGLFYSSAYSGNVQIKQAAAIAELVGARMSILKKQKGFEGYRIRIYAKVGAGARTQAQETRIEFKDRFDNMEAYLQYNSPNWEVHVGDFRTRMEAMQMLNDVKAEYAQAFIVKDIVEFPELSEIEEEE